MLKDILFFVGIIIIAVGVTSIFDARKIATKHFNSGETNSATKMLKLAGFILFVIGAIMIIIC